jgi:light-regulated signal transduction histidine kinase (bacteriophytochrome)
LRAPVRAMGGFARIVSQDFAEHLPPQGVHQLDRIQENASKMGQLIDGLLAFSGLSRQTMNKRAVEPRTIVQRVLHELQSDLSGRRVEISTGDLPACEADPTLLQQVYANLISNALKYTRDRDPAVIAIGCRQQNGEQAYFVKDNGAGFDMKYAGKLFGVFQRLHRAEEFEGTGVGLAIVQRIVHRHGGRVWAEAEPEKGATFYFTLTKVPAHA